MGTPEVPRRMAARIAEPQASHVSPSTTLTASTVLVEFIQKQMTLAMAGVCDKISNCFTPYHIMRPQVQGLSSSEQEERVAFTRVQSRGSDGGGVEEGNDDDGTGIKADVVSFC